MVVLEKVFDLGRGDAGEGQRWDGVRLEEADGIGLGGHRRVVVQDLAQEEELVDVVEAWRMPVPVAVVSREEPGHTYPVTRLLVDLACRRLGRGFTDVCPPSRQRPAAIVWLFDQKDAAVAVEDGGPYVDLRGCWPHLEVEKPLCLVQVARRVGRQYLGRYLPQLLVAPRVVGVLGVGEAVLGYRLQALDPQQPGRIPGVFAVFLGRGDYAPSSPAAPSLASS